MAMITPGELNNLVAFGESARQSQARHCRLGSAIHHPYFFNRRHPSADQLGHFHFERIRNTEANASLRRIADSANDNWGCVSENGRSPASDVIDQFNTIDRPNARAFRALDKNWFAAYRPKGPDRGIHTAGNFAEGASQEVA